jgi:hypothetical protein
MVKICIKKATAEPYNSVLQNFLELGRHYLEYTKEVQTYILWWPVNFSLSLKSAGLLLDKLG